MNKEYFAHETSIIDDGCHIGSGTKIWHFSHLMPNCTLGKNCNIGQNVVISPEVVLGNNVKEILLDQEGVKKLDLSDMNKGFYFGNLIVNNEVVSIKKLIVK